MTNFIAVTIGDINGIGIYQLIKEWKKGNIKNIVIFSNISLINKNLNNIIDKKKINKLNNLDFKNNYDLKKLNIYDLKAKNKYENTLLSLKEAYKFTKKKIFIGILTLPLNKNEINKYANKNFIDQTTFFSKLEKNKHSNMVFVFKKKIFIPLTTHIELKNVHKFFINKKNVITKILNLNKCLINDFGIKEPKLILAGINPHSGENGLISTDEIKLINPIVKELKKNKINICGPVAGDSIINENNLSKFDAFIFSFHDQALIPFKILSKFCGVNFTSNLDLIRVSPSHGTAKDMINNRLANSEGLINSFKLIKTVYNNRKKIDHS